MKSLVKLGVILIGLVIFIYAEVWGANWKLYSSGITGETLHYYDERSVMVISKDIVRVWTKTIYSEKDINDFVTKWGHEAKRIDHTRWLQKIDCKEKKFRIVSLNVYSKEGEILVIFNKSMLKGYDEWNVIVPETIPEFLYKAVCK